MNTFLGSQKFIIMPFNCIAQDVITKTDALLTHTFPLDILSSSVELGGVLLLCTLYKLLERLRIPCRLGSPLSLCKKKKKKKFFKCLVT
jgi:hypothetical protein